jgi:pyrrolysyl-tRNA synthetase-like protein
METGENVQAKTMGMERKRYYRKRVDLFRLIDKVKLWPSHTGILHGIKSVERMGDQAELTTHCNERFIINNSRNSRAARWLRNKWFIGTCETCAVPEWKIKKYSLTRFTRHWGSRLTEVDEKAS